MTTPPPKDGDLGSYSGEVFVTADAEGRWCNPAGKPIFYPEEVTPTGERAIPIEWHDDVKALAREMRGMAQRGRWADSLDLVDWADILDPPTPKDDA